MPLPNRVDPFGELFADPARGSFMGNRGGRFHTDERTLTQRRWVSRQWMAAASCTWNSNVASVTSDGG